MTPEKFTCPCCGYKTFNEKPNGTYEICEVCFWEDDPLQLENPDLAGSEGMDKCRGWPHGDSHHDRWHK